MQPTNLIAPGEVIELEQLTILKAISMAKFLRSQFSPYAELVECKREAENEIIVLKVEVEVPQITKNDIRDEETLAITFWQADNATPKVVSLRGDFPAVPHINLGLTEFPRSLCLFDKPYSELKNRLTPALLVKRIQEWLALTARGQLHAEDQPLEPLLLGSLTPLLLPYDLFGDEQEESVALDIYRIDNPNGRTVLTGNKIDSIKRKVESIAITIKFPPREHGQIQMNPRSLEQLQDFIGRDSLDLKEALAAHFQKWTSDLDKLSCRLIIIGFFPKFSRDREVVESDIWAFGTVQNIADIGEDLALWKMESVTNKGVQEVKTPGWLLESDNTKRGANIELFVLNPIFHLSRDLAAYFNKVTQKLEQKILGIGAGALGSRIIENCSRAGYGDWTIVDKDYLLPHNLARHVLHIYSVGYSKAHGMMHYSKQVLGEEMSFEAIMADVLEPGAELEKLNDVYLKADVILDMSASIAVPKRLVFDIESEARRISVFLNPSGTDLVILAESKDRRQRLDYLEMRYYQELIDNEQLQQHLLVEGEHHRYARSCSDLTNRIPNSHVSTHAAIVSRMLPKIIENPDSFTGIWSINESDMGIAPHQIAISDPITPEISSHYDAAGWTIVTNRQLIEQLVSWRQNRLPKETGGVFVGIYDFERQIIYVARSINSPSDSIECPTSYIRGIEGLEGKIATYNKQTSGIIEYIGEWHSHPNGFEPKPSDDDNRLFEYIKRRMQSDCKPTLMSIVGSDENICWLVDGE